MVLAVAFSCACSGGGSTNGSSGTSTSSSGRATIGTTGGSSGGTSGSSTGGSSAGTSAGSTGGTAGSSSTGTTGTTTGGCDSFDTCNSLVNAAPLVQEQRQPTDAPLPDGGTFVDGTYFLTAVTLYTGDGGASGPDGRSAQQTSMAAGGIGQSVSTSDGCTSHSTSEISFSGTQITLTTICPACTPGPCDSTTLGYTATPTTFMLFAPSGSNVTVQTYTLQP